MDDGEGYSAVIKLELLEVQENLEKIAKFLEPCLPLANAHATDFLTKNYWNTLLPVGIQEKLLSFSHKELLSLPSRVHTVNITDNVVCETVDNGKAAASKLISIKSCSTDLLTNSEEPKDIQNKLFSQMYSKDSGEESAGKERIVLPYLVLSDFFEDARLCSVEGTCLAMTVSEFLRVMGAKYGNVFIGTFMNEKKSHEVEVMSEVCAALAKNTGCKLLIEFGSGKGYLGKNLSQQYQLHVLGIDASSTNTESAARRNLILGKQWDGLTRNKMLESKGLVLTKRQKKKLKHGRMGGVKNFTESEQVDSKELGLSRETSCDTNPLTENPSTNYYYSLLSKREDISNKDERVSCSVESFNRESECTCLSNNKSVAFKQNTRFIPCTMFIDEKTDFLSVAKDKFPELFSIKWSENLPLASNKIACAPEENLSELHINCYNLLDETGDKITKFNLNDVCDVTQLYPQSSTENDAACSENVAVGEIEKEKPDKITNGCKGPSSTRLSSGNATGSRGHSGDQLNLMLTGLHTCGNLASTSLDMFVHNEQLKVLCNVGCCYHLIDERYLGEPATVTEADMLRAGFPMSDVLSKRYYRLGVTARNLASQSVHRLPDSQELQGERFFGRALLEVIIHDVCGEDGVPVKSLRKLEQKCGSIQEYLRRACTKLGISEKVSDEMIDMYLEKYKADRQKLAAFFQLKTVLAPCIEAVIILDRIAYLLENASRCGIESVYLVRMFDPSISPRCYGIIAVKQ